MLGIDAVLAGSGSLTKQNTGTLTLAGMTNTYSGGTTINQGTVGISADANLGAPATLTLNGTTLLVTAGTAANAGAGNTTLSAGRSVTLGATGGTISIGFVDTAAPGTSHLNAELAVVCNSVISGPGGLTVVGQAGIDQPQQSILDLSAVATYQGNTTINNAVVQVNSGNTSISGVASTAVVNILPTTTVLNLINHGAWNIDSGTANGATSVLTVAGLIGDATGKFGSTNGAFGPNNLTISGSGTYTFPGVIGANTVAGKTGSNALMTLTMNGAGTQILTGANTYSGGTTLQAGTLVAGSANALGSGVSTNTVTFTGGTLRFEAAAVPGSDISARIVGSTVAIPINTEDYANPGTGLNLTFGSSIAATNTGGLTKSGLGTLTLNKTAFYVGPTVINAGRLIVNGAASVSPLGSATGTGNVTVTGGAALGGAVRSMARSQWQAVALSI